MDWECGDMDSTELGFTEGVEGGGRCKWLIDPFDIHQDYTDPTLMALRVSTVLKATVDPPNDSALIAVGIISWNYLAADAAPTQTPDPCPSPIHDCELDWAWLWTVPLVAGTAGVQNIYHFATGPGDDIVSKARRRLGNDRSLLMVVDSYAVGARFHVHARALIKE